MTFALSWLSLPPTTSTLTDITLSSAGLATFVRIGFAEQASDIYTPRGDFLYTSRSLAILSTAELGIGITAACVATLRPLFEQWFGHGLMSRSFQRTIKVGHDNGWDAAYDKSETSRRERKSQKRVSWVKTKSTVTGCETLLQMPELVYLEGIDKSTNGMLDLESGLTVLVAEVRQGSMQDQEVGLQAAKEELHEGNCDGPDRGRSRDGQG